MHFRMRRVACCSRSIAMLDVLYLLLGAAFLGGCILYTYACDKL